MPVLACFVRAVREGRVLNMNSAPVYGRRVQFRVLGPLEVDAGDGPIHLGGPKQRSLLANLLVRTNQVVPAETLIDEVWGEEHLENARNTLQTHVSSLRKAVGTGRLQARSPGYVLLVGPDELDLTRFEELVREARRAMPVDPNLAVATFDTALALWRGPALADVADQPSLLPEAARLEELRLDAHQARIEGKLAAGACASEIGELEALVARHPLRESLWGLLMLALYREGRQADALEAFRRVREILSEELGIDPSPELMRLHERVLQQDSSLELRGEPLRGYRLLEKIGEGSAGAVFRAIQPHVGRDVAVKIYHGRIANDPDLVQRFEPEAQAVAALEHPHIVPVYDYWREPGGAYVVARYLRGGSLRALEERGEALGPGHAARVVEQVSSALEFAHRQGVAHGCVSASNVLLDAEGNAYLGDFRIGIGARPDPADDARGLAALARALLGNDVSVPSADATGNGALPAPSAGELRNPYKGLRAFTEPDAPDFFGRTVLTRRLVARLSGSDPGSRFVAVIGPSGCGKSSVVRAGLVPAIRRGELGGSGTCFVADMFPGTHPMEELEAALLRVAVRPASRLHDLLDGGSRGLLEAIDLVVPAGAEVLLVVDQFEEAFTLAGDERERQLFLESLRVAAADPESRLRVVVTLRADFYDRPLAVPRFGEMLAARSEALPPLTPDELEQAIRMPAERVGVRPEPGLVAEMIADVAHQPGALPLLQYALTELFEGRDDSRMTLSSYRELGGAAGALSARADRLFEGADPLGRRAIRQVFLRLVTLGEGRQDTRRRVARSELDALELDTAAIDVVLDAYGRHRLLTFDREPATREPTVEIAHEALLGSWGLLRAWIDEAREDLRQERRLARAAEEWRAADREPSFLMRGGRLDQVEAWSGSTGLAIGRPERAYLKASVDERVRERGEEARRREHEAEVERRSVRRLRGLVAMFAIAAIVAGSLTIIATGQRRRARDEAAGARRAETAELAQRLGAQSLVEEDVDLSLLLARQAVAIDDSPQTRSYLLAALRRFPAVGGVMHGRIPDVVDSEILRSIAVSPDGRTLAVGDHGVGLLFFDTRTYERIGEPLIVRGGVESVAYNPDGRTIAFGGGGDRYLRLIDARTREQLAAVRLDVQLDAGISRIVFTPDGSRLVVILSGGSNVERERLSVRDAATLEATGPPIAPKGFVGAYVGNYWQPPGFALTPDGHSAVIASEEDELVWWDLRSRTPARRLAIRSGRHPLALSLDGRTAAVGIDGGLQLVDTRSETVRTVLGVRGGTPIWLLFSQDGDTVVSTSLDGTVELWDVGSAALLETLGGHSASVMQPVFSPDGNTLYTVGHDGTAIAWDTGRDRGLERRFAFTNDPVPDPNYAGHPGSFSPDGQLIAIGLKGQGISLWDATDLSPVGPPLSETGGEVKDLAFSPDGRTLAAVSVRGMATIWDVESRSLRRGPFDIEGEGGLSISISADGTLLATNGDAGVKLWDLATGGPVGTIAHGVGSIGDIAFGPAGSMLAILYGAGAEGGTVEIWDGADGSRIATMPIEGRLGHDDWYVAIALSPDGRTLATGTIGSPIVRVVDLRTGELVRELDLGRPGVLTLDFSPDGAILAVSSFEPAAWLWDVATGAQIGPTLSAGDGRAEIDLSPDGRSLLLTHADGRGAVYAVDPESWAQRACTLANRTLTPGEWQEFLPGRPYDPACGT